jgi:gamma-glutamyl:cysteine ligase YbdK (ATP-grasp superfamily)
MRFARRLRRETGMLSRYLEESHIPSAYVSGLELEAWLLDHDGFACPNNEAYLARLSSPLVVPELSKFNVELNCTPLALRGKVLSALDAELTATWQHCLDVAREEHNTLVMIGILPTIRERDLTLRNITPLKRYHALNEQVLKSRSGRPICLDIEGRERLALSHEDVMLEAAATSFQLHFQVPLDRLLRYYNASLVLSAAMVAVSANSPFLFGTDLWDETRIPLFEQAVDTGDEAHPELRRVTFGSGYLGASAAECFEENLARFPVLLPMLFESGDDYAHLRLHNGTIWRWNRLLVGANAGRGPDLRIEHRVMPAGPTIADMIANAALYYGAVHALASRAEPPERDLPFDLCRKNFYLAAKQGLSASIAWLDGRALAMRRLVLERLLPMAREGLDRLGVDAGDSARYLDVIAARIRSGQNGAAWQRAHAEKHGRDLPRMTADYLERQRSGRPVHQWDL